MSDRVIDNPWRQLPNSPDYLLEIDREQVTAHNRRPGLRHDHRIRLEVIPEPFTGQPEAPVVLLNLNPGFEEADIVNYSPPHRSRMMRAALTHQLDPESAFWHLTPEFAGTGAGRWWTAKLNPLIGKVGRDAVRAGIQVIEYFPYKSKRYKDLKRRLPSQEYGFHLVRKAIDREALIVVMRSYKRWLSAVPEIESANVHQLRNPRNVTIGPGNADTSFDDIVRRLRAVSG